MLYPFLLALIAGITTMIGIIPIFIKIKNKDKLISASCSFASGVMVCVSVIDLIPEAIRYLKVNFTSLFVVILCFIFMIIGIVISMILDNIISKYSDGNNLFKVGILAMIVIILHNIPEDCITHATQKI